MNNELSQFNIKGTLANITDSLARSELESEALAISELGSEIDSQSVTYSEMFSEFDEDKQDKSTALKIGKTSATFTDLSITANGGGYNFNIPIPSGISNPIPVLARSYTGPLALTDLYTRDNNFVARLCNITNSTLTIASTTVEVTYLYN